MSLTNSAPLSTLRINSSLSFSRISIANYPKNQSFLLRRQGLQFIIYTKRSVQKNKSSFSVRCAVQPGVPPPSEPASNFLNWAVGVLLTVVLPFVSNKWTSFLRIKTEVESTVQKIEDIAVVVEKVAEEVEKVAEDIAEELPEGGNLRKAVDFVEHVAERASKDAHLVEDFINKVQEAEEKVEECVESIAEQAIHNLPKEDEAAHQHPQQLNGDDEETQN